MTEDKCQAEKRMTKSSQKQPSAPAVSLHSVLVETRAPQSDRPELTLLLAPAGSSPSAGDLTSEGFGFPLRKMGIIVAPGS